MTVAIAIGSVILLWQAYGYGVKNGKVIQDGMVFLSSQPNPASIYINGVLNSASTNTRLTIPSGTYKFELTAPGYRPWKHTIPVFGGTVIHYDYPLLFPINPKVTNIAKIASAPRVASQSPSQQYLVVSDPTNFDSFNLYDLTSPKTPPVSLTIPASLLSVAHTSQSWQVVGWADDNQHLLLDHIYDGNQEFIELDTQDPTQSVNLNRTFNTNPTSITLNNLKYDQFYLYDSASQTLSTASLSNTTPKLMETGVIAYKSYNSNEFLYITSAGAPAGQVAVNIYLAGKVYFIRDLPQAQTYLLNEAGYNGNNYAVVGDSSDNYVYIYVNPENQATASKKAKVNAFRAMKINNPNYVSFAPTAQFIIAENGNSFALYDIYNDAMYHYATTQPLDAPQTHVKWMDGNRLYYVSGSKLNVIDYDDTNHQTLTPAIAAYDTFFAPDYHSYFSLAPGASGITDLNQVSLIVS